MYIVPDRRPKETSIAMKIAQAWKRETRTACDADLAAQGTSRCAHAARNESRDSSQKRGCTPSLSDDGRTRYTRRDGYRDNNTVSRAWRSRAYTTFSPFATRNGRYTVKPPRSSSTRRAHRGPYGAPGRKRSVESAEKGDLTTR